MLYMLTLILFLVVYSPYMLIIRLQRVGRVHEPSFRIVLTDSKFGPKSGKAVEVLVLMMQEKEKVLIM